MTVCVDVEDRTMTLTHESLPEWGVFCQRPDAETTAAPLRAPAPTLLPPEAFSTETRAPRRVANPKHHPLLGCTLLSATAGAKETPSIERFHTALALDPIPESERWVVEVVLANATTRDLIRVWLDGGYSLRTLVRAMHALHGAHGNGWDRTESINRFALAPESPRRP